MFPPQRPICYWRSPAPLESARNNIVDRAKHNRAQHNHANITMLNTTMRTQPCRTQHNHAEHNYTNRFVLYTALLLNVPGIKEERHPAGVTPGGRVVVLDKSRYNPWHSAVVGQQKHCHRKVEWSEKCVFFSRPERCVLGPEPRWRLSCFNWRTLFLVLFSGTASSPIMFGHSPMSQFEISAIGIVKLKMTTGKLLLCQMPCWLTKRSSHQVAKINS